MYPLNVNITTFTITREKSVIITNTRYPPRTLHNMTKKCHSMYSIIIFTRERSTPPSSTPYHLPATTAHPSEYPVATVNIYAGSFSIVHFNSHRASCWYSSQHLLWFWYTILLLIAVSYLLEYLFLSKTNTLSISCHIFLPCLRLNCITLYNKATPRRVSAVFLSATNS